MVPAVTPASPDLIERGMTLWAAYDLRVIVLLSLLLETTCLILGPIRKRMTSGLLTGSTWFAYIFSGVISSYGVGLIRKSVTSATESDRYPLSLWAPILFIHLGGPDTMTAFSLEDNALWLRKYLNWFVFIYFTISIIGQSPSGKHYSKCPAYMLYYVGATRYLSWISSLLQSSMETTEMMFPRNTRLVPVDESNYGDYNGDFTNLQVLQHAYMFCTKFESLAVGFRFAFQSCSQSRKIFLKLTPKDAFRVVERELNFFYEVLYTKAWVVQETISYILRFMESGLVLVALVLFYKEEKEGIDVGNKVITYVLLLGSFIIDVYAMLMVLTADWFLEIHSLPKPLKRAAEKLTSPRHRWSNALYEYNLIERTFKMSKLRKFKTCCIWVEVITFGFPGLRFFEMLSKMVEKLRHVKTVRFDEVQGMKDFIVQQLRIQSSLADNPTTLMEIQLAKGSWILSQYESCSYLLHWINGVDFDECILTWHIATELCFHTDGNVDGDEEEATNKQGGNDGILNKEKMGLSKHLSGYMLYLLVLNPQMMSTVVTRGGEDKSKLTRDELSILLSGMSLRMTKSNKSRVIKEACSAILRENYDTASGGGKGKAILIGGCKLAKDLEKLGDKKWDVLSKVWFEMLCYTASHCQASAHMEQLKQGGQLVTIVWLLMVHFGLVN